MSDGSIEYNEIVARVRSDETFTAMAKSVSDTFICTKINQPSKMSIISDNNLKLDLLKKNKIIITQIQQTNKQPTHTGVIN